MSSTHRGAVRKDKDFYPTPEHAFLPLIPNLPHACQIWEPACGDRRLIGWMNHYGCRADGLDLLGNDYDFLADPTYRACIVTNPPFSLAFEFCQHALRVSERVYFLLPLNFLGSDTRKAWFKEHEPSALFILSKRPSFTPDGKTDSCVYAWFYWGPDHRGVRHL